MRFQPEPRREIAVAGNERRPRGLALGAKQDGVDIELASEDAPGAGLEKSGLAQLDSRARLGEVTIGRLEIRRRRGIEHEPRTQVEGEPTKPAQEVAVFPTGEQVPIGPNGVELDPSPDLERTQLGGHHTNADRDGARRSVGEYRSHLGIGKDPEAEDGASRRLELARRVQFTRREIERATHRLFGYAVQSRDVDGPEARDLTGSKREGNVGHMSVEIDEDGTFQFRERISSIAQGSQHVDLRRLVLVFIEDSPVA